MLRKVLIASLVTAALFTGCSSSASDSAESMGKAVCKAWQDKDFNALASYTDPKLSSELKSAEKDIVEYMNGKRMTRVFEKISCDKVLKIENVDATHAKVYFSKRFRVQVEQIGGKWMITTIK